MSSHIFILLESRISIFLGTKGANLLDHSVHRILLPPSLCLWSWQSPPLAVLVFSIIVLSDFISLTKDQSIVWIFEMNQCLVFYQPSFVFLFSIPLPWVSTFIISFTLSRLASFVLSFLSILKRKFGLLIWDSSFDMDLFSLQFPSCQSIFQIPYVLVN